jgi:hypothetical protein
VEGYEGLVDDLRLYATALDANKILALLTGSASRIPLAIDHDAGTGELSFRWQSRGGKLYNLRSEADPSAAEPLDWPIFDNHSEMVATPPENSLTFALPADGARYFVIEEFPAPPVSVFTDDFENGAGQWTAGSSGAAGTIWELGSPSVVGPLGAASGANCFGTNLAASYGFDANIWLRSPPIDLTTAGGATLNYAEFRDIETGFDFGTVAVLDAADNSELGIVSPTVDGATVDWELVRKTLESTRAERAWMVLQTLNLTLGTGSCAIRSTRGSMVLTMTSGPTEVEMTLIAWRVVRR